MNGRRDWNTQQILPRDPPRSKSLHMKESPENNLLKSEFYYKTAIMVKDVKGLMAEKNTVLNGQRKASSRVVRWYLYPTFPRLANTLPSPVWCSIG